MTIVKKWAGVYKLTDAKGQTRNSTQWGPEVTNPCGVLSGEGGLCGSGFYHAYHAGELAVFLNPLGANFPADTMRLWEAEIRGAVETDQGILKLGASEMRTVREVACPRPTMLQRTAFSVLVALATLNAAGLTIPGFVEWGEGWLSNLDRSSSAANAAAAAAYAAANAANAYAAYAAYASAASASAAAAAYAANAAANAAYAANAVNAANAAYANANAASAAAAAAYAGKWSVEAVLVDAAVLALAETWED